MQAKPIAKCPNGHFIQKLCFGRKCTQPSIICQNNFCQHSSKKHAKCNKLFNIDQLLELIKKKQRMFQPKNEKVIELLNGVIKSIEMIKQQYFQHMKTQMQLEKDEREFYKLLIDGPVLNISPTMVDLVIESLQTQSTHLSQNGNNKIILLIQQRVNLIERQLTKIRKLWQKEVQQAVKVQKLIKVEQIPTKVNQTGYYFDSENHHKNIMISNGGKVVANSSETVNSCFALMSPPLNQGGNQVKKVKVKFLNHDSLYGTFVGLATISQRKVNQYAWGGSEGVYIMSCFDGMIYNKLDSEKNRSKTNFKAVTGDIVEMTFDPTSCLLTIQNKTRNIKQTMDNIDKADLLDLCFCVNLEVNKDSVQIIDQ